MTQELLLPCGHTKREGTITYKVNAKTPRDVNFLLAQQVDEDDLNVSAYFL